MNKVAIVGAGIAGIATAVRLAIKGYKVDVFEKNSYDMLSVLMENKKNQLSVKE